MTQSLRRCAWAQWTALAVLMPGLTFFSTPTQANPTNGVVTHGFAEINSDIEGHLQIFQHSDRAIINWEDFNISAGEITEFIQSGQGATALSRVMSGNPSAIFGTLKANGGHILINPNGILVGAGGVVDVAGMNILSTLDVDDNDFLAGGDMRFTGSSAAGVTNYGAITGGDVILLGNFIDNQGTIGAPDGVVAMGAGGDILVSSAGDSKISVSAAGPGGATGINNTGSIEAASVELKAHGNVYALAINNSGMVRANGFNFEGGRLTLDAGPVGGKIVNTGTLAANNGDGSGGAVTINAGPAGEVDLAAGSVKADGVGGTAGGVIDIQAAMISVADGVQVTANGSDGGSVNIGSAAATESVTIGAGANVSANGATGAGGVVNVTGTSASTIDVLGSVTANGATSGGQVAIAGGNITTGVGSVVGADGGNQGGTVSITGDAANGGVNMAGLVSANGGDGAGGAITVSGSDVSVAETGVMQANGASGGSVTVDGENVVVDGTLSAVGSDGDGGLISVTGSESVNVGATALMDASGSENGGTVLADSGGEMNFAGTALAGGTNGVGGAVTITGEAVNVAATAVADASGGAGGGNINVGGGLRGKDGSIRNSQTTNVAAGASFSADSINSGNAGQVVVWGDGDTIFEGDITARALGVNGNGGLVEVSGLQHLHARGSIAADSANGLAGTVLFDPGDVEVGAAGSDILVSDINNMLQGGTNVLIFTEDGSISFLDLGGGGNFNGGVEGNDRDIAIQWTESTASFGAFAGNNININNHIRTSGGGSINLIAGWTGAEVDAELLLSPEDAWEFYVENGNFGNGGSVFINSSTADRHVEVGSRFGNTNVATSNLLVTASDTNSESRNTILGFRDTGSVFAPRFDNIDDSRDLDLNDGTLVVDNDPVVGIVGQNEVDRDGDTIVDGVYGINSLGVLHAAVDVDNDTVIDDAELQATGVDFDGDTVVSVEEGNGTFIPYANHFNGSRVGNWWWQQIDAGSPDSVGIGGLLPGHGAGGRDVTTGAIDLNQRADINIAATSAVILSGGGRHENSAQIGHAGNASAWGDNRSLRDTNLSNMQGGQTPRLWSFNGASSDRVGTSIAQYAGVYGNINILAGVDADTVQYDASAADVNLTGTVVSQGGIVQLEGLQRMGAANNAADDNNNGHGQAYVQIGHGGTGQFGSFSGNINIDAGGDITLNAGSGTRGHATIGHTVNGYAFWNPTNKASQIRFFANTGDFDNPNLRRGELFSDGGVGLGRGAYDEGTQSGRWDDDFFDEAAEDGVVQVEALNGSVKKTLSGDINVRSNGVNGITIKGYETPDQRDSNGDGGLVTNRDRRFAGIGHGGSSFEVWNDHDNERVRLRVDNTTSDSVEFSGSDNASRISRNLTFMDILGDINVEATQGDILIQAGNGTYDYARIGHGGNDLADLETSNVMAGDVTVTAGGDVTLIGGGAVAYTGNANQNLRAYAQIGHGGYESGFQYRAGDIDVTVGGNLTVTGGAYEHSYAKIGHQGSNDNAQVAGNYTRDEEFRFTDADGSGPIISQAVVNGSDVTITMGSDVSNLTISGNTADIVVDVGGDILMDHLGNGERLPYNVREFDGDMGNGVEVDYAYTQIGHGGRSVDAFRYQNAAYNYDDKVGDITVTAGTSTIDPITGDPVITGGNITLENGSGDQHWTAIGHRGSDGADRIGGNEAMILGGDITVNALGSVVLDASAAGSYYQNDLYIATNENALIVTIAGEADAALDTAAATGAGSYNVVGFVNGADTLDPGTLVLTTMLGGEDVTIVDDQNGNLIDEDGVQIGTVNYTTGAITITAAFSDSTVTADYVVRNEPSVGTDNARESSRMVDNAQVNQRSPVVIGHGGAYDNYDIVVLGDGADINGIVRNSDINLSAGGDLTLTGGTGLRGMQAQVGHGYSSDVGNDRARLNNVATGYTGDINVSVGNDLTLNGGDAGVLLGRESNDPLYSTEGNAAVIGHGGHQMDAPTNGDITVYVGNNATLNGGNRTGIEGVDQNGNVAATRYNLAQVGHWNTEMDFVPQVNGQIAAPGDLNDGRPRAGGGSVPNDTEAQGYINIGGRAAITEADTTGDITFVIGNDLSLNGGTTSDTLLAPAQYNYAHIGNGGPGVNGDKEGDITVLVGNDIISVDGTSDGTGLDGSNNYVQIGHADWLRDSGVGVVNPITGAGTGNRIGNITVAAGNNITLDHTLIGHADRAVIGAINTIDQDSNTYIAASRNSPFTGGTGTITTTNETVFTSGFYGFGGELRIYVPERANNLMDGTTRLNEADVADGFTVAPANQADPFDATLGANAGRADEIYLQPDLWWDNGLIAAIPGGGVFPTDATSGQGGAIATVNDPGGLPNLVLLSAGVLGDGTAAYNASNGISGLGNYTIYYDALNAPPGGGGGRGGAASGGGSVVVETPVIPFVPVIEEIIEEEVVVAPAFNYLPFLFVDKFDSFDRDNELLTPGTGSTRRGLFSLFRKLMEEPTEEEVLIAEGYLEDDGSAGDDDEEQEEDDTSKGNDLGKTGGVFYVYDSESGEYSSYREFGVPAWEVAVD